MLKLKISCVCIQDCLQSSTIQYNLSPGIATPMGPTSRRRLEFIALRYLQDYMLVTHLAIPLKEAL